MKMRFRKTILITISAVIGIFHVANGQSTTTNDNKEFRVSCTAISGNNLFAGTDNGVYLSTNSGEKWIPINNGLPEKTGIYKIVASGSSLFLWLSNYSWFMSTNNGTNWKAANVGLADTKINDVALFRNKLFAATDKGLFMSDDNGLNWAAIPKMAKELSSFLTSENYIVGSIYIDAYQSDYFSSSDGVKWQTVKGLDGSVIENIGVGENMIYAKTCKYTIYNSNRSSTCKAYAMWVLSENGKKWEQISLYPRYFGFYRNNIYAIRAQVEEHKNKDCSYKIIVVVSENRGKKWTIINEKTDPFVLSDITIQEKLKELRDGAAAEIDQAKRYAVGSEKIKEAAKKEKERRGKFQYGDPYYVPLQTKSNDNAQKSNDRFHEMNNHRDSYIDSNGGIHIK